MMLYRAWQRAGIVVLLSLAVTAVGPAGRCLGQSWDLFLPGILPQAAQIFGADSRTRVHNTTVFPYSAIGRVISVYGNLLLEGTGVMIGQRTVLTAGHVVFDPVLGWPDSIDFIAGADDGTQPFGSASAIAHVVAPAWQSGSDDSADIGLVVLKDPVGSQTGFMVVESASESFLAAGLPLRSAGYPADLGGTEQFLSPGESLGVDGNFLLEDIDTESGQSGSPVWYEDSATGQPRLVAVLKGTRSVPVASGPPTIQGIAVCITPQFATLINTTLARYADTVQVIPVPDTSSTPPAPVAPTAPQCGACGAGTGQAVLGSSILWLTGLLCQRRRP